MALFRRYQSNEAPSTETEAETASASSAGSTKKGPTPSRRQAEAERRERLHPTLSKKELKAREKELARVRQDRAYVKLESQPERVLMRNMVDAKWSFSEFVWPLMFLALAALLSAVWQPVIAEIANYIVYGMVVIVTIEVGITWYRFKNVLKRRYPGTPTRGLLAAMISRMITMRRFRRPGTALNRGDKY